MTNLAYVIITLVTNTPTTNFIPSGQMQVRYEVQRKYVYGCTNEGQLVMHTNLDLHSEFTLYFNKRVEWVPANTLNPAFIPVPPLPNR